MSAIPVQRHLSLNVGWGRIDLDLGANTIRMTQDWCYRWDLLKGTSSPSPVEGDAWHAKVQRALEGAFYGVRIQMTRKVGRKKQTVTVGVSMDAVQAPESRQWTVSVRRVPSDCQIPVSALVNTSLRTIALTESELSIRELARVLHRLTMPLLIEALNEHLTGMNFAP